MSNDNRAQVKGFLGEDPRTGTFQSGGKWASFSLATTRKWKSKDGDEKEDTQWHNISVLVDFIAADIAERVKKGSLVRVEGMLETRKWQKSDGTDGYTTEIVVRPYDGSVDIIAKAPRRDGAPPPSDPKGKSASAEPADPERSQRNVNPAFKRNPDIDDDIPF